MCLIMSLQTGKDSLSWELLILMQKRPVSYAQERFSSSSYEQWIKSEASYDLFWKAFDHLSPNRDQEEEWQYMIAG